MEWKLKERGREIVSWIQLAQTGA